jgi:hypothetical protein
MLKQMDLELTTNSNIDNKEKNIYNMYKKKNDEMKSRYFKIKENYTYTKKMEEMILSTKQDSSIEVDDTINSNNVSIQVQKIIEKDNLISQTDEKIQRVKRAALEIENTCKNVMINLESQNQKLNSTHSKINGLNTSIENSGSILNKIINKEHRNKAIIGMFSVTLVTLFFLILCSRS